MDARVAAFLAEALVQFRFLVDSYGFQETDDRGESLVGFLAPPFQVWVSLDEYNNTVDTNIRYDNGREIITVPLLAILIALGWPAQLAPTSAQTRKGMARSIARQAESLGKVLARLLGVDGPAIIMCANE